jgi:hypothetical protein
MKKSLLLASLIYLVAIGILSGMLSNPMRTMTYDGPPAEIDTTALDASWSTVPFADKVLIRNPHFPPRVIALRDTTECCPLFGH